MATNRTFTMIKPDAVQDNHIGGILSMIEAAGFRIVELQKVQLTPERAGQFYEVHKERPFYQDLVKYMSSGPIVAAILEKDNAVADFRTLIGATNPANAEDGTIRKKYAKSIEANACADFGAALASLSFSSPAPLEVYSPLTKKPRLAIC